jgi:hypothetical protein
MKNQIEWQNLSRNHIEDKLQLFALKKMNHSKKDKYTFFLAQCSSNLYYKEL